MKHLGTSKTKLNNCEVGLQVQYEHMSNMQYFNMSKHGNKYRFKHKPLKFFFS